MPRTRDAIAAYLPAASSFLGFAADVLVPFLDYDRAKPYLKDGVTREGWEGDGIPKDPADRDAILADMRAYMEFGWGKVSGHRGISAARTIEKMSAWLWLLEDDEGVAFAADSDHYAGYGAPILAWICRKYGFPIPEDPGIANMIEGQPCCHSCEEGC